MEGSSIEVGKKESDAQILYQNLDIKDDVYWQMSWNSKGILENVKLLNEDGEVIYVIGLAEGIPGYELPILLRISAVASIGLIYIIMKKK